MSIDINERERMEEASGLKFMKSELGINTLSEERLDFHFERVQLQFDLRNDLTKLHVANNMMHILTSTMVYRIDLENPSDVVRVTVPPVADKVRITNSWVHNNGRYLIVQVNKTQYFVLHLSYRKFKILPRFKGLDVQSMAFGSALDNQTTGDFLFATADGSVYVALLKHHDPVTQENKRDDKYAKQLFNAKSPAVLICFSHKYCQIQLFLKTQMMAWDCMELTLTEITRSLRQRPSVSDIPEGSNGALVLALANCYYYVTPKTAEFVCNDEDKILNSSGNLPVEEAGISTGDASLFMTPHHFVHLSQDQLRLCAIDKLLSQDPVVKKVPELAARESILALAVDYTAETYWLYTSNNIHEVLFSNEATSVWYSYYKINSYDKALEVLNASAETPDLRFKKNVVLVRQGYYLLQRGSFGIECDMENVSKDRERLELQAQGIKKLAKLQEPFEKVCLLLFKNNGQSLVSSIFSDKLLLDYLTVKFIESISSKNKIQQIALSSWIVKLYLRIVYVIQQNYLVPSGMLPETKANDTKNFWQNQRNEADTSLSEFLVSYHKFLDQLTIYQLMKELGFFEKAISFAEMLEDYEYIVDYKIDMEDWSGTLKALSKLYAKDPEKGRSVVYRTSETLLLSGQKQTVDTWLRFPELDYEMLLPAILSYNKSPNPIQLSQNQSVNFLQRLIFEKGVKNTNLNIYYLSLLITYACEDEEAQAEKALTKALEFFQSPDLGYRKGQAYDSDLILRLSLRFKKYKSAILVLINDMNLHEAALIIALEHKLTSMGEFILKSYHNYTLESQEMGSNDFIIEGTSAEDSRAIGKIKLEDESFAFRRKLWLIYAKYIVKSVCNGEILDITGLQVDTKKIRVSENAMKGENTVQEITSGMLGTDSLAVEVPEFENSRLNRALQHLLRLSYSSDQDSNILTLKDLLPLFPENIKIIHFREEIVESLNLYNTKINQLGLEMQELTSTAQKLKLQIEQSFTREAQGTIYTVINPGEACQLCGNLLIDKNFIIFPNCHHGFHKDCTVRFYLQLKGDYRFKKIFQDFKQTSSVLNKTELDKLLQSECLLCSDSLLNKIEDPLIDSDKEKKEWDI